MTGDLNTEARPTGERRMGSTSSRTIHLADIPFSETLPPEPDAPPVMDFLSKDKERRAAARAYWIRDPLQGALNLCTHHFFAWLPTRLISGLGGFIGSIAQKRFKHRVFAKRIADNLTSLRPDLKGQPAEAALTRWWQNMGRTLAEFSKGNTMWRDGHIKIEGKEHVAAAEALGRPLIFVTVHVGTWEAIGATICTGLSTPTLGIFEPEPNRFTNRLIHRLRKARNQYIFPPGQKSAFLLRRILSSGDNVATSFFLDEVRDKQIHMPLFGRSLPTKGNAINAVKLANGCQGTLLPMFIERIDGPDFVLHFLPPLQPADGPRRYELTETLQQFNSIFEPIVLEHVTQWYMLRELRLRGHKPG